MDASPSRANEREEASTPRTAEAIRILQSYGDEDADKLADLEERRRELHRERAAVRWLDPRM